MMPNSLQHHYTLSHFENECDVTSYFTLGRTETHAPLSVQPALYITSIFKVGSSLYNWPAVITSGKATVTKNSTTELKTYFFS